MNSQQLEEKFKQEFSDFKGSVQKPNILMIGGTGVGKSSLINTCFGEELAKVGVGKPVTTHIESFSCNSKPITLFDTKGYEIGSSKEKEFLNEVVEYATNMGTDKESIHIAWYCIQANGSRIVDFDISIIKQIYITGLPIAIVLTKADLLSREDAVKLHSTINKLLPQIEVFETTDKDDLDNLQLAELCQWSVDRLPSSLRVGFVAAQSKNINLKRTEAKKIIKQHITGAGFVGFTPIPFSDAPILVSNQMGMIARILFIYDMDIFSKKIMLLIGNTELISGGGVWIAAQLIKMVPVIGTVIGGAINATVAVTITYAIGISVSEFCANILEQNISGNMDELKLFLDNVDDYFINELTKNLKKGNI